MPTDRWITSMSFGSWTVPYHPAGVARTPAPRHPSRNCRLDGTRLLGLGDCGCRHWHPISVDDGDQLVAEIRLGESGGVGSNPGAIPVAPGGCHGVGERFD